MSTHDLKQRGIALIAITDCNGQKHYDELVYKIGSLHEAIKGLEKAWSAKISIERIFFEELSVVEDSSEENGSEEITNDSEKCENSTEKVDSSDLIVATSESDIAPTEVPKEETPFRRLVRFNQDIDGALPDVQTGTKMAADNSVDRSGLSMDLPQPQTNVHIKIRRC